MTSPLDEPQDRMMVDKDTLTVSVTLASNALTEALEALSEATKAMSDAGLIVKYDESTRVLQGIVSLLRSTGLVRERAGDVTPPTPENISLPLPLDYKFPQADSKDEGQANHKARRDSVSQHVVVGHQAQSQSEQVVLRTSSPAPSISLDTTEVESALSRMTPVDQFEGFHSSQPGTQGNWIGTQDTPESEHDNEHNFLHEPPFLSTANYEPFTAVPATEGVTTNTQPYASILQNACTLMESYPPIPAGRNYIQLDQASDALAFLGYMSLQAYRTIPLVPDQLATTFSELLKSLTRTNVHRITTVHEFQHISTAFRDILVTDSYDVLVISTDLLNFVSLHDLYSDCVLHWGQPPNANLFISRAIVFLPLTATVCMIVGKQDFNGLAYAVAPYPELVLAACLLFGYDQRVQMELWKFISNTPTNPIAPKPLMPPAPSVSYQQALSVLSLPPGHYYILLDTAKEIDIIPVVVLLAMNTRKVMCRVTTRKDLYHYRRLMRGFDLNIIIPKSAKYPAVKAAMDELKSDQRGILLPNKYKDWNIHFSRSLVNCLIFCGIPPDGVTSEEKS